MNIGNLNERVAILELVQNENAYNWEIVKDIWTRSECLNSTNLFSKVGLGVKSIKFTIRKNKSLTLHNAFRWKGRHCFITDIKDIDRMYYEVTAALIEPVTCSMERTGELTHDELNRPVYVESEIISFPACLVEKYLGHTQDKPMAVTEVRYVLVTPKPVELHVGEVVNIGDKAYTVLIPHTLDEYKNEYEIMAKDDA